MNIEENNSPSNPRPEGDGSASGNASSERGPRRGGRSRDGEGRRRESSPREGGSGDYKPSDSAARREGSEHSERRPERSERSPSRGGRPRAEGGRSGQGDRRGGKPDRPGRSRSEEREPAKKEIATPITAPKPKVGSQSFVEELGESLLASVSRSFSITIKALPEGLREPITAGYLLARSLDTIADTAEIPVAKRLEHLRALLEMIKYGVDPELLRPLQKDVGGQQSHEGEQDLIEKLDRCLAWLEALPAADQWDLRRTLARIGRGQELDLLRFGEGTAEQPKALANETELDEYTYFVAGCVGELWTQLCERHLPAGWSKLEADEMLKLGKRFGQGLQMVNILRDLPSDLEDGRCYLPETLLTAQGLDAASLVKEPAKAKPILTELRGQTVSKLDDAWKYARSLTPRKLRYACALPVLIGFETLGLLAQTSPLESEERIKVSKTGMRGLMISSAVGTALSAWNEGLYRRTRKRAAAGL